MVTDKQLAEWRKLAEPGVPTAREANIIIALLDEVERLNGALDRVCEDRLRLIAERDEARMVAEPAMRMAEDLREERDALRARCDRLEAVADGR